MNHDKNDAEAPASPGGPTLEAWAWVARARAAAARAREMAGLGEAPEPEPEPGDEEKPPGHAGR